jgi:hypothetical protein
MAANDMTSRDPTAIKRARLLAIGLAALSLSILGSASCSAPAPGPAPASTVSAPTPRPTLAPIQSARAEETVSKPMGPLAIFPLSGEEVERFGLFELEIQTDIAATNPFDPEELEIRVKFSSESGTTADVGAFWYQDYQTVGHRPLGESGWRVRFTPTEAGDWTAVAHIPERGLQSEPFTFHVLPSGDPGFVRINPEDPRYLAFENGDFFFPIGLNMGWWSGAGTAQGDYKRWMDLFAANGGDTIRVWMAEWSFGLEWNDTPLGDYSRRLLRAWLLDRIFAMAEEHDIYIVLVLLNCADFNNWQTDGWNHNPYNAANGGPLDHPSQFVTDPTARALLQRRLNYILNRWGYSTHLLAWEWWNEVNLAPFTDESLVPWLQEMTAYLRARDINRHLLTNSYAIRDVSPMWSLPELEIIQKHEYALQDNSPDHDLAGRAAAGFERLAASAPPKPIFLGEFGYGNEGYGTDLDKTGIHLHNGIWATTFVGYAGSGMYWYWDVYVEAYNAWHHFLGLSRFLEGLDLARYQPFSPLEIRGVDGQEGQAVGLGLRGEDVLVWMRSAKYTVQAVESAWKAQGSPQHFIYAPPLMEGLVLTLRDMEAGEYTIHWYDPQRAQWLDPVVTTAEGGSLSIRIPEFRRDLSARIIPDERSTAGP